MKQLFGNIAGSGKISSVPVHSFPDKLSSVHEMDLATNKADQNVLIQKEHRCLVICL